MVVYLGDSEADLPDHVVHDKRKLEHKALEIAVSDSYDEGYDQGWDDGVEAVLNCDISKHHDSIRDFRDEIRRLKKGKGV